MIQAYIAAYRNAIDFEGRSSRKDYWGFFTVNVLVTVLLLYIAPLLAEFYAALSLIPGAAVAVRRVHDRNLPWYSVLIPFYNMILMFLPGDEGINQYGANTNASIDSIEKNFYRRQMYCENCGAKLPPVKKRIGKNTAIVIVCAIAILSIIENVRLFHDAEMKETKLEDLEYRKIVLENTLESELDSLENENSVLEDELYELKNENSILQKDKSHMREEMDFYETNIALIPHWNADKLYHKYWCKDFQNEKSFFFAYDIEHAKELGAIPCPECFFYELLMEQ